MYTMLMLHAVCRVRKPCTDYINEFVEGASGRAKLVAELPSRECCFMVNIYDGLDSMIIEAT